MKLFSQPYISKNAMSPFDDILKELALYKQTSYCYEYIKKRFPDKSEEEIKRQAEISSSCFRQAFEFYDSANLTYITTSPLLYSYSLNNFAKGLAYLWSFDSKLTNYFKRHGFKVEDANIANNILDSYITIEKSGPPTAILTILNNHIIEKQKISFKDLLQHIPEISDIYLKTTHECSCTAIKNARGDYELKSENWEKDKEYIKEICEYLHCCGSYSGRTQEYYFFLSMASLKIINESSMQDNIYYKDKLILPLKLEEGIYSINIMYYSYLLIMSYGMLVRYNAEKWEKFIDTKISNEAVLINESVNQCVKIFLSHVHMLLFNYTYENTKYDDENVKRVIKDSTKDIMNNIKKDLEGEARRYGRRVILPW